MTGVVLTLLVPGGRKSGERSSCEDGTLSTSKPSVAMLRLGKISEIFSHLLLQTNTLYGIIIRSVRAIRFDFILAQLSEWHQSISYWCISFGGMHSLPRAQTRWHTDTQTESFVGVFDCPLASRELECLLRKGNMTILWEKSNFVLV